MSGGLRTAFWGCLAVVIMAAAGCAPSTQTAPNGLLSLSPTDSEEAKEFTPDQMAFKDDPKSELLYEVVAGQQVHVGDPIDELLRLVPRPAKSFPMSEVPSGLSREFEVKGWETRLGAIGFITTGGRLALMLEILDQAEPTVIESRVATATSQHGNPDIIITRGPTKYWFWEQLGTRKMMVSTPDHQGRSTFAAAMGNASLMTALRMNPEIAKQDADTAQILLSRLKEENKQSGETEKAKTTSE